MIYYLTVLERMEEEAKARCDAVYTNQQSTQEQRTAAYMAWVRVKQMWIDARWRKERVVA